MAEDQSLKVAPYFVWRIENISSTLRLKSPIFTVADGKFSMILQQYDGKSTMSMETEVENQQSKVAPYSIEASVSIMDPDKSFKDFLLIQKTVHRNRFGFKESHLVWEVETKILDDLDVVQEINGKKNVTFLCVFGLLCKYQKDVADLNNSWCKSLCMEALRKDLDDLRLNEDSSCVLLKCGSKTLKAHKVILSARSGKFADMFQDKSKTKKKVEIKDMEFEVLENLITYIYTGRFKDIRPSDDLLIKLYETAHKYKVEPLRKIVIEILLDILRKEHEELFSTMDEDKERLTRLSLDLLVKTDEYKDENFKDDIMGILSLNNDFILKEEKWKIFRRNNIDLAMEVYDSLTEVVIAIGDD